MSSHTLSWMQLYMLAARRHLKSPQSLCGISTPPWLPIGHGHCYEWSTHILFVPWQSAPPPPIPQIRLFWIWPWNYKFEVMAVVTVRNHTVSPVSNWFAFILFHINQITIPAIQLFSNQTLRNQRSRLWVKSNIKVTYFTQYPTNTPPFRFTWVGPTIPEICPIGSLTLKKTNPKSSRKMWQKWVFNGIHPKANQVISITRPEGYSCHVL